jgi:hypothetical protein
MNSKKETEIGKFELSPMKKEGLTRSYWKYSVEKSNDFSQNKRSIYS